MTKSAPKTKPNTKDQFPLIDLNLIRIVPKPTNQDDIKHLFCNPRGEKHFSPEKMEKLQYSIRIEGLLEPLIGRPIYHDGGEEVDYVELIAGERRTRTIRSIVENDLPCRDPDMVKPKKFSAGSTVLFNGRFGTVKQQTGQTVTVEFEEHNGIGVETEEIPYDNVLPTTTGKKRFEFVPVKLIPNCDDREAFRVNWSENDTGEPLLPEDDVNLIERLLRLGFSQKEIAVTLSTNVTFVSQTASFREQLPQEAFAYLMEGKMARHIAVKMLSFSFEDRELYFQAMKTEEVKSTAAAIQRHAKLQIELEDQAELLLADAKKAESEGDSETADKLAKRAENAEKKANKSREKKDRAKSESGIIKQGHAQRAAAKAGIVPKKAQMLPKEQIEERYIKDMLKYSTGKFNDPVTGEEIPCDYAAIVRRTAMAIVNGQYDPLTIIREYMIANGEWEPSDEQPIESTSKKTSQNLRNEESDDDFDEDDDDIDPDFDEDYDLDLDNRDFAVEDELARMGVDGSEDF